MHLAIFLKSDENKFVCSNANEEKSGLKKGEDFFWSF